LCIPIQLLKFARLCSPDLCARAFSVHTNTQQRKRAANTHQHAQAYVLTNAHAHNACTHAHTHAHTRALTCTRTDLRMHKRARPHAHTHAGTHAHNAHVCSHTHMRANISFCYGVATVSRIDKIIGLFCRISSLL